MSDTSRIPEDGIMLSAVTHVCIVVEDVDRTARNFASKFGIGPFTIRTSHTPEERGTVGGNPAEYTLKFGYAQAGPVVLELVQPLGGESIYTDFLRERGEGIHHIGFSPGGLLEDEIDRWKGEGIDALQTHRRDDPRYGWAYMDTETDVGCILEVVCDPPLGWWESKSLSEDLRGPLGEDG